MPAGAGHRAVCADPLARHDRLKNTTAQKRPGARYRTDGPAQIKRARVEQRCARNHAGLPSAVVCGSHRALGEPSISGKNESANRFDRACEVQIFRFFAQAILQAFGMRERSLVRKLD
jgi:hypothetical protein